MGSRILPFILSGAFCALAHAEDPLDGIKKIAKERIGDRAQISAVLGECAEVIGRLPKRTEPNFEEEFRKVLKAKKDHPNFRQIVAILGEAYKVVAPNPDEWGEPEAPGKEEEEKREEAEEEGKREGDKKERPVVKPADPVVTQPTEGSPPGWEYRKEAAKIRREVEPDDPDAQSEYGEVEFYSRDYERALDGFGSAIRSGDTRPKTLLYYGRSAYQLGDFELAAQSFAIAQRMGDPQAAELYKLVAGRSSRVKLDSALAAAGLRAPGSVSSPQPELASAASAAGAYVSQGAGMTAAEIAAVAARQAEAAPSKIQQSSAVTRQAASALRARDYSAAHALSSQAIDLNPRNAQAWNYRAIAGSKLGRYADAVYDSSFALGLAPDNAAALQTRSWAFSKQRKYKEGLADANLTLEKDPSNGFAYQNRAFALAGMGDRRGVLDSLRRSAQINPQFQPKYEEALQLPEGSDLLFLFDEESGTKAALPAEASAPASQPVARNKRFLRLVLLSLSGGLLVALGLLHIVSASWREKVRHTMRRVLGGARGSPAAEGQELFSGFWTQYQPIREIGIGGMGVVYEALDRSLDRRVAIKKMRDEIRLDAAERQRFILEARTVASLHHPNIVDIYSIVEDGQEVYLVFEYVPGRTLFELMREKGPMDFDQARAILRGACEAVEHAHRQKIVHRDVKPSNIMISEEGVVKVMDFGVARQAKEAITKMAMTNTIVGTPPYMAPEQEQGTVRKESDVFALGVCLYEMLCGQLPFTGQGAGMLLNKINARHVPLSQQVKYGLPKGLDEVLAKVLAPDPEKRYRTPSEFLAALEAVAAARLA